MALIASEATNRTDLAQRRQDARHVAEHLRFLGENVVEPALVKDALLSGLGQSATAKLLGISKQTGKFPRSGS